MVDHFVAEFKRKHNKDVEDNPRAIGRLRAACEKAKRIISSATQTVIEIDCLYEGIDFSSNFSRARFEMLNKDLLRECIEPVDKCLKDAKKDKSKVDDVVLVGGSTWIPKVQQLQDFFDGKELCRSLNPDEAVAYGAAVQAAILSGIRRNEHFMLVDVTPLSLGTEEVVSGELSVVIPRNTPIPTTMTGSYTTAYDNQTSVNIPVYEGERPIAEDNRFLGRFHLDGIPRAPKGVPIVKVTFQIDVNGILTVTSEEESLGNTSQIIITKRSGNLSKADIQRMVEEARKFEMEDREQRKLAIARFKLQQDVSDTLEHCDENMDGNSKREVEDVIEHTTLWLESNVHLNVASKLDNKLKEVQNVCNPLVTKSHPEGWRCSYCTFK